MSRNVLEDRLSPLIKYPGGKEKEFKLHNSSTATEYEQIL